MWSYNFPTPLRVLLLRFCDSVSADRIVMAASRLLRAVAVFVILLSFAAGLRKIVLEWLHEGCHSDLSADFSPFWRQ